MIYSDQDMKMPHLSFGRLVGHLNERLGHECTGFRWHTPIGQFGYSSQNGIDVTETPATLSVVDGSSESPPHWVHQQQVGSGPNKAVLWALSFHIGNASLMCWTHTDTISFEACTGERTTQRAFKDLAAQGLIASIPLNSVKDRLQTSCVFIFNIRGWLNEAKSIDDLMALVVARYNAFELRTKQSSAGPYEWEDILSPRKFVVARNRKAGFRLPGSAFK